MVLVVHRRGHETKTVMHYTLYQVVLPGVATEACHGLHRECVSASSGCDWYACSIHSARNLSGVVVCHPCTVRPADGDLGRRLPRTYAVQRWRT